MLLPEEEFQDPEKLLKRAKQAAQLYLNRWQIEQSFRVVKQHFGLEKLRVRTYIRLVNILALCYLCHVFNHFILPAAENSAKVTKIVKDNFHDIISHPIAMLAEQYSHPNRETVGVFRVRTTQKIEQSSSESDCWSSPNEAF